jgi:hypothetical protein
MKKLIVLCGTKQSGKTSSAAVIMGYYLTQIGVIPNFNISPENDIYITHEDKRFDFNIESQDPSFKNWLQDVVYPHVKNVGFADTLKEVVSKQFGIPEELMWGTNDEKNSPTHIELDNIRPLLSKKRKAEFAKTENRPVTVREMLEIFGTDICRQIDPECHIRSAFNNLEQSGTEIGIITDCRFANEFLYCKNFKKRNKDIKCFLVKMTRQPFTSSALSEQGLPEINLSQYDMVFDNADKDFAVKSQEVINYFIEKNVLAVSNVKVQHAG